MYEPRPPIGPSDGRLLGRMGAEYITEPSQTKEGNQKKINKKQDKGFYRHEINANSNDPEITTTGTHPPVGGMNEG